ncbi:BglG family transcription antiterminator LicT [Oceanobacillus neutriphilus]|uniref:Transcriptional antiterminator n=1 Tax=Oceanobacillus neutriphilus TaxID=531815 RepID=A0ABQ2NQX0_9BACI|nr:PRD domain-containing protein [Oceanobacillus neutriphilus]GGP07567.1 transcriptional antiterminator [Oceanobacillus neutriphilus]
MKLKKVYNNNVVLAENSRNLEHIIIGRGIAFNKKIGDQIEDSMIEKLFVLQSAQTMNSFFKLLDEIPINHLELTNRMVEAAEKKLGVKFDESVYIGLADHITYALERNKNHTKIKNELLWEIKQFYKKEYEAALESLKIIHYYENMMLSEDEAAFITLHFVNAQQNGQEMQQTVWSTEIIHDIITMIRFHFKMELNEDSSYFSRFVLHLRFFLRRVFAGEFPSSKNFNLLEDIDIKYPKLSACVDKIIIYLEKRLEIKIHNEERFYLILHINRILN